MCCPGLTCRSRVEDLHCSCVFLLCPLQALVTVKVALWFPVAAGTLAILSASHIARQAKEFIPSSSLPHRIGQDFGTSVWKYQKVEVQSDL